MVSSAAWNDLEENAGHVGGLTLICRILSPTFTLLADTQTRSRTKSILACIHSSSANGCKSCYNSGLTKQAYNACLKIWEKR